MPKDYYLVLGITSDATLDEIKDAYRRLAKTFHPDHYGDNHSPFLAVQEAYAILSDPIKRQTHDLERLSQKKNWRPRNGQRIRSAPGKHIEPLIPEDKQPMDLAATGLSGAFHTHRPDVDVLSDPIFSNFRQRPCPKSENLKHLNVVITLTPEQAFQGGQIQVTLPAQLKCPSCSGQGWIDAWECGRCGGEGVLPGDYPVMINYPPGISDHHVVQMPLDTYGIQNLYLTVHFRIRGIF